MSFSSRKTDLLRSRKDYLYTRNNKSTVASWSWITFFGDNYGYNYRQLPGKLTVSKSILFSSTLSSLSVSYLVIGNNVDSAFLRTTKAAGGQTRIFRRIGREGRFTVLVGAGEN